MAFENLNCWPAIWKNLGLNYLLFPGEIPRKASGVPPSRAKKVPPLSKPGQRPETKPADKPEQVSPVRMPAFKPVPVADWPKEWQAKLESARKGRIAWTYWKLGNDLAGCSSAGDNEESMNFRRNFLQKIIRDLKQPPGTHTFWPISLPSASGQDSPNAEIFWSALPRLGCRGVVIMGSNTAKALFTSSGLKPLTHRMVNGMSVWILWDIDSMATSDANYDRILAFLGRWFNSMR